MTRTNREYIEYLIQKEYSNPHKVRTASEANDRANKVTRLQKLLES